MWNQQNPVGATAQPEPRQAAAQVPPSPGSQPAQTRGAVPAAIGSSVFMKGDLRASEDLTVEGQLEGRIDLPDHALTIGPNANVKAHIAAKVVTVFGTVVGVVTAQEKIDVRSGAVIEGEITCARIAIQDGAVVTGKVAMSGRASKPNDAATSGSRPALAAAG